MLCIQVKLTQIIALMNKNFFTIDNKFGIVFIIFIYSKK